MHFHDSISARTDGQLNRRSFLKMNLFAMGALALPTSAMALVPDKKGKEKVLSFYNTHTGERLKDAVYWAEGGYVPETLHDINYILRDFRQEEVMPIDPDLLDLVHALRGQLDPGGDKPLHIISGYRSPATNKYLRKQSSGVAKRSLHMDGKAIDIRMPGVDTSALHRVAVGLQRGGVGFYKSSDFVHVDVGPVRYW